MAVRVRFRPVNSSEYGVLVIVNRLYIMLIIKSVIQSMVIFMLHLMTSGVLMLVIVAFVIVSIAMRVLIGGHIVI